MQIQAPKPKLVIGHAELGKVYTVNMSGSLHTFVSCKELCIVPDHILKFLCEKLDYCNKNTAPDLVSTNYHQWNLQHEHKDEKQSHLTTDWKNDDCNVLVEFFHQYVKSVFRFRLSTLGQSGKVDWHGSHRYPRIHIPLNSANSEFVIRNNAWDEDRIIMNYGNAYMINVTLPHMVPPVEITRHNAFFSFNEFATEELTNYFTRPLSNDRL